VAQAARFSPIQRSLLDRLLGTWRLDHSPSYTIFDYVTRTLSPYQTNPGNYNPLERVLEELVDFDVALMREMRTIAFVGRLVESGKLDRRAYKRMNIHLVEADEQIRALGASSKLNAERAFLEHLKAIGRSACDRWLDRNFDHIGVTSTVDLVETYL
jgi:NTE family protein